MPRHRAYKRPTPAEVRAMTPSERLEHTRALERERQRRRYYRIKNGPAPITTAREKRQREGAELYDWKRLLPHIEKLPDGCWRWLGSFQVHFARLRPLVRAGAFGREFVDHIVCCLTRGRPPPNCFVKRTCANIECVAPDHLVWSNKVLERAKRRRRHEQEELVRQ